ncbi:MAG: LemA family protein [Gammaproteobacteria bacterium]|nr:LemA family protein [Gammaproteobacteria bacterium]
MEIFGWVIVALIVGIPLWGVLLYNRLVNLRNQVKNAWRQIDVQLKRRHDLIPNLVEVVKDYMSYEQETLDKVIQARNQAVGASNTEEAIAAEGILGGAMGKLFALMENYPDLKANENMIQVQEELTSTENRVAFARQAFNDAITEYNTSCEKFPANMIAGPFGFRLAELLESTESPEERKAVKVSF